MPIAFFSRKLSATEKNYSAFDRVFLGSYEVMKHFRHFVEARPFTLYTDRKPLTYALPSASEHSPGQARHLLQGVSQLLKQSDWAQIQDFK